jgi:hypothetical protein
MGININITKKPKRKMEFSKRIFTIVSFFCVIITIFTMAAIWKTNDTSALAYLIPSWFVELATATGFYYDKAKAENINKNKTKEDLEDGI